MILRENSLKPQMQYWEHDNKSHQCNHYHCEGYIKITRIIHKDTPPAHPVFILAEGVCSECGQRYLVGQFEDWFERSQETHEEPKPMTKPAPKKTVESEKHKEQEIDNLSKLMRTITTASK